MQSVQSTPESVPILIVGAGPTGLTIANLLGLYNVKVLLIEKSADLYRFPRAISIDDEGLRICQALGLGDAILPHVRLATGALYLSRQRRLVHVRPRERRNGYPLISTFAQPELEAALLAGLQRFPHVEVRFGHTLQACVQTEQGLQATLTTTTGAQQQINCSYLLACDGGKSSIRQSLGIPMRGRTFPQRWLVVDCLDEDDSLTRHDITFFCDPERPMVSVPAPGAGRRWEIMLHPGEREEQMLEPATVNRFIQQKVGSDGEHTYQIIRQAIYTFHASHISTFSSGQIFFLGDAAHLLPPFGGQGMNSGLRDAYNLAWKLAMVLRVQARPAILASYQQERAPHVIAMIRFSALMGQLVMPTSRLFALVRDITIGLLTKIPPVASSLVEMRVKPGSTYKHGLFLTALSIYKAQSRKGMNKPLWVNTLNSLKHLLRSDILNLHPLVGQLLPQPVLLKPDGTLLLLDEQFGTGFTLLRLYPDPQEAFTALQTDIWHKLATQFLCILPAAASVPAELSAPNPVSYLRDDQQQLAHFLSQRRDIFVLVRPDRYILGVFTLSQEQAFAQALQQLFFSENRSENSSN